MRQRLKAHPFFSLFDAADPSASTGLRTETTTPTQALFLLNSPFVHDNSVAFARRILSATQDDSQRISLAYEAALGREPAADEVESSLEFVRQYIHRMEESGGAGTQDSSGDAWAAFCRSLFVSNDFLFVE